MKPFITAVTELTFPPTGVSKQFAMQLRRADDHIKLGVSATEQVYPNHGEESGHSAATGLFVGTAFGPMQTNFDVLGLIVDEDQTSPTMFSHSVFNSAAGYIARLFNISGSCFSLTDFSWPFFQALDEGARAISSGRLSRCVVLQLETYSDLLIDARASTTASPGEWPQGAVAWLLSAEDNVTGWQLGSIEVATIPASPEYHLHRKEEFHSENGTSICSSPLAAAVSVTRLLQKTSPGNELNCRLTAPYGSVTLTFLPSAV